ncbi:MAG TPA: hypothetical protein VJX73_06730 [Terracidiphilus sp.]|nr:hypothetical protein [Terracidiphilus sp.]
MPHNIGRSVRPAKPRVADRNRVIPRPQFFAFIKEKWAEIASSRQKHGKNQRKWANVQENPKKPVEIGCFSIDFHHLKAAL